jgi:uncharacterized membrane protein
MLFLCCMDCCISGLEKYKVVLVLARALCVMIFDIELKDIEYELPQLENFS